MGAPSESKPPTKSEPPDYRQIAPPTSTTQACADIRGVQVKASVARDKGGGSGDGPENNTSDDTPHGEQDKDGDSGMDGDKIEVGESDGNTAVVGDPDENGTHVQATEMIVTATANPTPIPPCTVSQNQEKSETDSLVCTTQQPPPTTLPTPCPIPTTTDDGENLGPGAGTGDICLLEANSLTNKTNYFSFDGENITFSSTYTSDCNAGLTCRDGYFCSDFGFPVDDDNITTPDSYKDPCRSGASIYSNLHPANCYQYACPTRTTGTDMCYMTGTDTYDTGFTCDVDYLITDRNQYFYDCMTYNIDSFDNTDPELSTKAPAAFRAYAYTLAKPYDMDDGNSYFI